MTATFPLLGGRLILEDTPPKPPEDALWLAASLTPAPDARVLDAMCGPGTVGLALLARVPSLRVTALDIDPALAALAARNARLNHAASHHTATADLAAYIPDAPFDAAFCNPPFHAEARGHTAATAPKRAAKSLPDAQLARWLDALHRLTTPTATLALVVHAACRNDLLAFAKAQGCGATLIPLQTASTRPSKRLLAHLRKDKPYTLTEKPPVAAYDPHIRAAVLGLAKALPSG